MKMIQRKEAEAREWNFIFIFLRAALILNFQILRLTFTIA